MIKRLYTFMLQRFLPLLVMTFFICLFIVLMQFLWRYIDDLVGKGLSVSVICELFFYAALTMVPTALPLAVLLASLMTFGNLGEKFELTALKAAGISLFQIMAPLIVLMSIIAIGAFYFQNNVLPIAQTKMWTLLFSMRQKSPEVEIPVKSFYDQIPGLNLFVENKNHDTGMLYDMVIYDVSKGFDNSRVILADSGKLNFTEDKTHLFLHLYKGEMFENLKNSAMGSSSSNYMPFRRESFSDKQIYFIFDANFNRMDESTMRSQYIGKNITELRHSIDSIGGIVDSIGTVYGTELMTRSYVDLTATKPVSTDSGVVYLTRPPVALPHPLDLDSVFAGRSAGEARSFATLALNNAKRQRQDYEFKSTLLIEQDKLMRRHDIELQRRFTLSFACLIFFFIGAPLGAIIKKGGIGTPLVISIFLFIVYYIFDNMGYKLARDGKMAVWAGIWLSSAVMLPLGIFFTYKAVGDSAVFNIDAYKIFFDRLRGKRPKRSLEPKEVIMSEVDAQHALAMLGAFLDNARQHYQKLPQDIWHRYLPANLTQLTSQLNDLVEYLSNSRSKKIVALLNEYPFRLNRRDLKNVIKNTETILQLITNQQ